jgi:hypothetical protein
MGANVWFDDDEQRLIDAGELIFLGVVCYNVESDKLDLFVDESRPSAETQAILAKFIPNARLVRGDK